MSLFPKKKVDFPFKQESDLEKNRSESDSNDIVSLCRYNCGVNSTILLHLE